MRSTYRALIVAAALAVAGRAWAQEPSTPVEVSPTPPAAQQAPEASQAAPAVPNPEAVPPAELAPIPKDTTTLSEVPAAPAAPAPTTSAPQSPQPASVAPAAPSKIVKTQTRKTRETTTKEPVAKEPAPETAGATAGAAAATTDAGPVPPSSGASPQISDTAVAPAPVADQRPVVEPVTTEARAPRTGSTVLLVGGLLLGVGAIGAMLARRRRNESVSIMDHDEHVVSTRPPLTAAHQRSRPTQGLS